MTLLYYLLLAVPTSTPSPVAYILQKNGFTSISLLSSSTIVTENLLLTTKYPIFTIPKSNICVLPVPNFKGLSEDNIRINCIDIKNIHFSKSNVTLIELQKKIAFVARVNTAIIPEVTSIEKPFKLNSNCKMIYHERTNVFDYVVAQKLDSATITEGANTTIDAKLASSRQYCVQDNGVPLYCESAVIGIFMYESTSDICCVNECTSTSDLKVLKLYTEEVQSLLKKYVPP